MAALALGEDPVPPGAEAPGESDDEPAVAAEAAEPEPPARLEPLTGRYWSDELWTALDLDASAGTLAWIGRDRVSHLLTQAKSETAGERVFETEWGGKLRFTPHADGSVGGFVFDYEPSRGMAFRRIDDPVATLLIRNARLIDGTGAPARTGSLRIAGDRIAAVGERGAAPGRAGLRRQGPRPRARVHRHALARRRGSLDRCRRRSAR